MFFRRTTEGMQRTLQAIRQGAVALAALHDMHMSPATMGQAKLVQQVPKWLSGKRDGRIGMGEIRQPLVARRH